MAGNHPIELRLLLFAVTYVCYLQDGMDEALHKQRAKAKATTSNVKRKKCTFPEALGKRYMILILQIANRNFTH